MKKIIILLMFVPFSVSSLSLCSELAAQFKYQSWETGLPEELLIAVAFVESSGNSSAVSRNSNGSYDLGLFQLNSEFIPFFEEKFWDSEESFDPFNPRHSIVVGSRYLAWLVEITGSMERGIVAYNVGLGSVLLEDKLYAQARYFSKVTKMTTEVYKKLFQKVS